ncbi:hypothetical protein [Enterocloster bolteae]|uniref:hypothetical protein n=1 Tax=Enterocloster bolteae TaxID=208479 RepID=UPI0028DB1180|nr:hypothetical protein [Enterocloster bolteae]
MSNYSDLTEKMLARMEALDEAAKKFCRVLLDSDDSESVNNPFYDDIVQEFLTSATSFFRKKDFRICVPALINGEGRSRCCTLNDCRCGTCKYQESQEERKRVIDIIETALEDADYKIFTGDDKHVYVRSIFSDKDINVRIEEDDFKKPDRII